MPEAPGDLDFAGGLTAATDEAGSAGGMALRSRLSLLSCGYVGGRIGIELTAPAAEATAVPTLLSLGLSGGLQSGRLWRLTARAGGFLDGLRADDWPSAGGRSDDYGWRLGYTGAVCLWLFRLWGHPGGLELNVSHQFTRIGEHFAGGFAAGLFFTGVLLPDAL
jgi:hypothetical protein